MPAYHTSVIHFGSIRSTSSRKYLGNSPLFTVETLANTFWCIGGIKLAEWRGQKYIPQKSLINEEDEKVENTVICWTVQDNWQQIAPERKESRLSGERRESQMSTGVFSLLMEGGSCYPLLNFPHVKHMFKPLSYLKRNRTILQAPATSYGEVAHTT